MSTPQEAFHYARASVADEHAARTVLVDADPGTGVRGALVGVLAQVAVRQSVLIVTSSIALIEQWRWLLRATAAALPVERFDTQAALELAQRDAPPAAPGVYLATTAQLSQTRGRAGLVNARFHLVVLDNFPQAVGRLAAGVEELTGSCDRVLVLGASLAAVPWPGPTERIRVSYVHTAGELAEVLVLTAEVTGAEREVEDRARELLATLKGDASCPNRSQLHSALIREITRVQTGGPVSAGPGPGVLEQAWQLVDALESLGPDPLVPSLLEAVSRSVGDGPVFVVASHLLADAQYVLSALADAGYRADLFPRRDSGSDPARLPERTSGDVVVVTPMVVDLLDRWPERSSVVLWHTPRIESPAAHRLLRFAATARRVIFLDGPTDLVERLAFDLGRLDEDRPADLPAREQP